MLENVDLTKRLSKEEWKEKRQLLQDELYNIAYACRNAKVPICVIFEGWDTAGKGESIKFLTANQDPRGFRVEAITDPRTYEQNYPWLRRFWLRLPNYGEITIFDTSWYRRVLQEYVEGQVSKTVKDQALRDIYDLERMLADDGTIILKFWLHISKKEQKQRLQKLEKGSVPGWRDLKQEWKHHKKYDQYLVAIEEMFEKTEAEWAPWHIIGATDSRYTRYTVLSTMIRSLRDVFEERGIAIEQEREGMTEEEKEENENHD